MKKQIKPGTQAERGFLIERSAIDEEARTVELAFSSEAEYERWWGIEILDHEPGAVRLGRLKQGGAVLMDHNTRDHVGVIESVRIDGDRVGRAVVRFGRSARADEVFQDVLDGIRQNVSVGYVIHKAKLVEERDGVDVFRVTDWEPFEVSLVSVPADPSVGVGRGFDPGDSPVQTIEDNSMHKSKDDNAPAPAQPVATPEPVDVEAVRAQAREAEQQRVADIIAIGDMFKRYGADEMAADAIRKGVDVDGFRQMILERVNSAPVDTADIGMSDGEVRDYSVLRVLNALANPTDMRAREAASYEFEVSRAAAEKYGKEVKGVIVPYDVLRRELVAGTPSAGGDTVATDLLAGDFISMLRHAMVIDSLGVRVLSGLQGNIAIPRQTGGATAYWVNESAAPSASQQAFDQVAMTPKTLGARTQVSRKLLIQSSLDVEGFVRQDLAVTLAQEIQRAAIHGSGTAPEPRGILNVTGIGAVVGGTNGAAPTWKHIIDLETAVSSANADVGSLAYLTNAKVRGKLKGTEKFGGSNGDPVWERGDTPLNGYRAGVTNAVPSNLTKGTGSALSAILFGNWADLVMGLWGGLELQVDPYSAGDSGSVVVRAFQDIDLAVRHPESFAAMTDAITA